MALASAGRAAAFVTLLWGALALRAAAQDACLQGGVVGGDAASTDEASLLHLSTEVLHGIAREGSRSVAGEQDGLVQQEILAAAMAEMMRAQSAGLNFALIALLLLALAVTAYYLFGAKQQAAGPQKDYTGDPRGGRQSAVQSPKQALPPLGAAAPTDTLPGRPAGPTMSGMSGPRSGFPSRTSSTSLEGSTLQQLPSAHAVAQPAAAGGSPKVLLQVPSLMDVTVARDSSRNFDILDAAGVKKINVNVMGLHPDLGDDPRSPVEYVTLSDAEEEEMATCSVVPSMDGRSWQCAFYEGDDFVGELVEQRSSSGEEQYVLMSEEGKRLLTVQGSVVARRLLVIGAGGRQAAAVTPTGSMRAEHYQATCEGDTNVALTVLSLLGVDRLIWRKRADASR